MYNLCATKIHPPTICAPNKYNSANLSWVIFKLYSQFPKSGLSRLHFWERPGNSPDLNPIENL